MTAAVVLSLPDHADFGSRLANALSARAAVIEWRHFPDGESYVRLPDDLEGRPVVLNCSLARPDPLLAPLLFAADAARDLGATQVGLVAPYLAYMRQDRRFKPGEAVTSRTFSRVIANAFDWLVTVDPHLHRYASLGEIYTIPCSIVHGARLLGQWIGANVQDPLLLGPDAESAQWVAEVAAEIGAPHAVFTKTRLGDREVRMEQLDLPAHRGRQPVLIDDIASSGRTLLEAANRLAEAGFPRPVAAVTHALFAEDSFGLLAGSAAAVVSTDTVLHSSNAITVVPEVASRILALLDGHPFAKRTARDNAG